MPHGHYFLVQMPDEHIEALMRDAYEAYFQDLESANLAVVSRGGTAVFFDRGAIHVVPFEEMSSYHELKAEFAEWQANGDSRYFGIRMPERLELSHARRRPAC